MTTESRRIILGSQSPRRRELLTEAGYHFEVMPPSEDAEGGDWSDQSPAELVARLAQQKAADVARRVDCGIVIGCDTVAECRGQILGKPRDEHHAAEMLRLIRGREHRVLSGLCVWRRPDNATQTRVAVTTLRMDAIPDDQLNAYLESRQWEGKAGAFGYQDRLGWIHIIDGSASNVVGLPLEVLAEMLKGLGET